MLPEQFFWAVFNVRHSHYTVASMSTDIPISKAYRSSPSVNALGDGLICTEAATVVNKNPFSRIMLQGGQPI
jgi:hypothetical protein